MKLSGATVGQEERYHDQGPQFKTMKGMVLQGVTGASSTLPEIKEIAMCLCF